MTCEEYVVSKLEKVENENRDLMKMLKMARDIITGMNVSIDALRKYVEFKKSSDGNHNLISFSLIWDYNDGDKQDYKLIKALLEKDEEEEECEDES